MLVELRQNTYSSSVLTVFLMVPIICDEPAPTTSNTHLPAPARFYDCTLSKDVANSAIHTIPLSARVSSIKIVKDGITMNINNRRQTRSRWWCIWKARSILKLIKKKTLKFMSLLIWFPVYNRNSLYMIKLTENFINVTENYNSDKPYIETQFSYRRSWASLLLCLYTPNFQVLDCSCRQEVRVRTHKRLKCPIGG